MKYAPTIAGILLGLLVGILVGILAFHLFIMKGEGLFSAPLLVITVLAAFLLWCGRKAFAGLSN